MLSSDAVGFELPPAIEEVSARRLLAFAAGIGDTSPAVFDDRGPLRASPAFCVSLEWPLMSHPELAARLGAGADEMLRGVHVGQDSHFARPIEPGMMLSSRARLTGLRSTRAGAISTLRIETADESGPLVSSWVQLLFRGVAIDGPDRELDSPPASEVPAPDPSSPRESVAIPIARELPHVYSECARIWNPIHTERRVALAVGLPDILLHGTATWALAGREIVARHAGGDPSRLRRLSGRFRAMVIPGSEISLEHAAASGEDGERCVTFEVRNAEGQTAIDAGLAVVAPAKA